MDTQEIERLWLIVRDTFLHPTTRHVLDGKLSPSGHNFDHNSLKRLSVMAYQNKLLVRKDKMPEWMTELVE